MNRLFGMLSMLARENLMAGDLARKPEEHAAMDSQNQATAWHAQGADDGPILPIYHLNALACSRLAPAGSTVVDLGCGSGRYAAYLARRRPDLRIVGFDLSASMVTIGNAALHEERLADRVELRQGDMTAFFAQVPPETGLINCLFAIHHLPGVAEVEQCLTEIRRSSEKTGCGFWIFDLVRPRHASTAIDYPQVFTPDAPQIFREDSTSSLVAAYSHAEMARAVEQVFRPSAVNARLSRLLRLYQAYWRAGTVTGGADAADPATLWSDARTVLPPLARSQYRALRAILPGLPS